MNCITRFAPSPTGMLHLGSARTALFNQLFALHHGGKFLLRIEDTDVARSTKEAIRAILDGLAWLGITSDAPPAFQSQRSQRHQEIALTLLEAGHAYKCFTTPEELQKIRIKNFTFKSIWRHRPPLKGTEPYVVRLKIPEEGDTILHDLVQGTVSVKNTTLDDFVLLRADGRPTFMLAVVVDDHDMNITHVIRGDDHFTNTFRQLHIYHAMKWAIPEFGHIPLIHGVDGKKLSKRHGALSIMHYKERGILSEAMNNYLLRLGWAHRDEEIISKNRAISLFDHKGFGKSPARFDFDKLIHLNEHYIRASTDETLSMLVTPFLEELSSQQKQTLIGGMSGLKIRARTLVDLAKGALIYFKTPQALMEEKASALLTHNNLAMIRSFSKKLQTVLLWDATTLEDFSRKYAAENDMKFGQLAQPLRAKITGRITSPSLFEVMALLGKDETFKRLSTPFDFNALVDT